LHARKVNSFHQLNMNENAKLSAMKKTAIIILNYNNASDTITCIKSIGEYEEKQNIKIILVDNKSDKQTRDSMGVFLIKTFSDCLFLSETELHSTRHLPYISFIQLSSNYGYAKGNNFGLALSYQDSDIDKVMILNNDVILTQAIIPQLSNRLYNNNNISIISPLLLDINKNIDHNCARQATTSWLLLVQHSFILHRIPPLKKLLSKRYILKNTDQRKGLLEVQLPSGSCMLLKKAFFQEIDSFDPNTFLYLEEDILYDKIKRLGKKNYVDLDCSAIHLGASTMKKTSSVFVMKAAQKSLFYYMEQYLRSPIIILLLMRGIWSIRLKKAVILQKMKHSR
jgi:GT2 family glycosyltransferase